MKIFFGRKSIVHDNDNNDDDGTTKNITLNITKNITLEEAIKIEKNPPRSASREARYS